MGCSAVTHVRKQRTALPRLVVGSGNNADLGPGLQLFFSWAPLHARYQIIQRPKKPSPPRLHMTTCRFGFVDSHPESSVRVADMSTALERLERPLHLLLG